jgi:hypothetical protein
MLSRDVGTLDWRAPRQLINAADITCLEVFEADYREERCSST